MPMLSNSLAFAAIVGAENIAEENVLTIAPASTTEVSTVVKICAEQGLTIAATGSGTKQDWGNSSTPGVVLDTRRMTGVREHSWGDLTATVAAGTPWNVMQQVLAQHGQRVALDPLFADEATIGGVLATNDSGLLRLKYGSLRDLVIGITIVLADGTVASSGGRVVKNVAGYDLPKLLIGSFGTLGILTEVTFRLHPLPQHTASFTVRSPEVAALAQLMAAVLESGMSLEAMQMRTETLAYALDLQFASLPNVLIGHEQRLRAFAASLPMQTAEAAVWQQRDKLFSKTDFGSPADTVLKITALPSKLSAIVAGMAHLNQLPDHTARCIADPVGIVTAAICAPPDALATLIDDLRLRLASTGGAVVILRRGGVSASTDTWGAAPAAIDIMRAIKKEFDPQRLLNPGKFVGGI